MRDRQTLTNEAEIRGVRARQSYNLGYDLIT